MADAYFILLRKVIFLNIKCFEKKDVEISDVKKVKGSKRWRHLFCLDSSFSYQSLDTKVPEAQMPFLLFTPTPREILSSTGFRADDSWFYLQPHPNPKFQCHAFSHLPDLLPECAVGISNLTSQTELLDFILPPSFLHSGKCWGPKPCTFLSPSHPT